MAIEIVDFPINSMVIFHSYVIIDHPLMPVVSQWPLACLFAIFADSPLGACAAHPGSARGHA